MEKPTGFKRTSTGAFDAYPEVPRELLRRPRRNKVAEQQAIIDALVAALEGVMGNLQTVPGTQGDAVLGPTYLVHGITINKVDAALAMARKGG